MKKEIISGLESQNLGVIEKVQKSNWHSHAGKGGNVNFVEQELKIKLPRHDERFDNMKHLQHWVSEKYGFFTQKTSGMLLCWEACFDEAKRDNYVAMTQSFSIESIYAVGGVEKFINIVEKFKRYYCPDIQFYPEIRINRDGKLPNTTCIEELLSFNYFKSIDLCGDENVPVSLYAPVYRLCEKHNLLLKAHVGEYGGADTIVNTIQELHLGEIYHGINAAQSNEVMKWLKEHEIVLHVCPTSNVMLGIVGDYKEHPIKLLFHNGVKVTVNTDDLLVFNKSLSQEYMNLYINGVLSANEISDIILFSNRLGERGANV